MCAKPHTNKCVQDKTFTPSAVPFCDTS